MGQTRIPDNPRATPMQTPKYGRKGPSEHFLFSIPIWVCVYALIISPLLLFFTAAPGSIQRVVETRHENKVFLITVCTLSLGLVIGNLSRRTRVIWPTHILCLLAYLAFAGVSTLWAFSPELSLVRFVQQVMVVASTILPAILVVNRPDMLRPLFYCFAVATILNLLDFAVFNTQTVVNGVATGFGGYFMGKNYVGECAGAALLLSLHELAYRGVRRTQGLVTAVLSVFLLVVANSKTALALAAFVPVVAAIAVVMRKTLRISPAILVGSFVLMLFCAISFNWLQYEPPFVHSLWRLHVYGSSNYLGLCRVRNSPKTAFRMGLSIFLASRP